MLCRNGLVCHDREFAIRTRRIGRALSEHGVAVTGIELSPAIVAQLAAKSDAGVIDVTIGDMATASVDGEHDLMATGGPRTGSAVGEMAARSLHEPEHGTRFGVASAATSAICWRSVGKRHALHSQSAAG